MAIPGVTHDPVLAALGASERLSEDDQRFLLRHGRAFSAVALPGGIGMRKPGECFAVARELAQAGWGVYTRGFALRPGSLEPLAHAWVSIRDAAFDATWPEAARCAYFGIPGMVHKGELVRMSKPYLRRELAYGFSLPS